MVSSVFCCLPRFFISGMAWGRFTTEKVKLYNGLPSNTVLIPIIQRKKTRPKGLLWILKYQKKNPMLFPRKKKYAQESQVNLDHLTTNKHSPIISQLFQYDHHFFLRPQQNHMFFSMFLHIFCVAPKKSPTKSMGNLWLNP